jgi:serine/threonine protein kinase
MLEKPIQIRNNIFNKKLDIESEQTNPTTIKSKSQSSNVLNEKKEAFKTLFSNKDYLVNYLRKNYPSFGEEFELTNFISTGGTGVVYAGQLKKRKNAQKLAIKFKYSKRQNRDKDEFQEIGILKKLHHKNITNIYAFAKVGTLMHYCVLDLGKHGDLEKFMKTLLKRKVLSETILCYFAKQILEALEYMHKCKIIHNDIKQGNIVVDANLDIKITDFSVSCTYANFEPDDCVEFPFMGTSKYICPEILGHVKMAVKEACKIDLYSFGVTLYELAFGKYPYKLNEVENKKYDDILNNIKQEKLEFPKDKKISTLFKDFLSHLLDKNYQTRYDIQQCLNHPWIKGAKIINDEKENIYYLESFLINVITDNIPKFNDYINQESEKINISFIDS